jgi:rubrerythrin
MTIRDRLAKAYMRRIVATPGGRAFILTSLADAEANGESKIFDAVLSQVDDPALRRMVKKHQEDEVRHAALYRAAAEKVGVPLEPIPANLKLLDRLDAAVGGFLSKPISDALGVMEAYVMLQVIEERGITQFRILESLFREHDVETAEMIGQIAGDEERHLRYCLAISKRYAPNEEIRLATLAKYRELEARCFAENGEAMMAHTFGKGLFDGGPVVKWFWKTVQGYGTRSGSLPYTDYATQPVAYSAAA